MKECLKVTASGDFYFRMRKAKLKKKKKGIANTEELDSGSWIGIRGISAVQNVINWTSSTIHAAFSITQISCFYLVPQFSFKCFSKIHTEKNLKIQFTFNIKVAWNFFFTWIVWAIQSHISFVQMFNGRKVKIKLVGILSGLLAFCWCGHGWKIVRTILFYIFRGTKFRYMCKKWWFIR